MFHDYTLTKLAREHVRELLAEKQAHEVTKSRWPQRNGASGTIRGAASSGSCAEAAGACR